MHSWYWTCYDPVILIELIEQIERMELIEQIQPTELMELPSCKVLNIIDISCFIGRDIESMIELDMSSWELSLFLTPPSSSRVHLAEERATFKGHQL